MESGSHRLCYGKWLLMLTVAASGGAVLAQGVPGRVQQKACADILSSEPQGLRGHIQESLNKWRVWREFKTEFQAERGRALDSQDYRSLAVGMWTEVAEKYLNEALLAKDNHIRGHFYTMLSDVARLTADLYNGGGSGGFSQAAVEDRIKRALRTRPPMTSENVKALIDFLRPAQGSRLRALFDAKDNEIWRAFRQTKDGSERKSALAKVEKEAKRMRFVQSFWRYSTFEAEELIRARQRMRRETARFSENELNLILRLQKEIAKVEFFKEKGFHFVTLSSSDDNFRYQNLQENYDQISRAYVGALTDLLAFHYNKK